MVPSDTMTETERTGREARTDSEAPTDKKDPDADAGAVSIAPGDNRAREEVER